MCKTCLKKAWLNGIYMTTCYRDDNIGYEIHNLLQRNKSVKALSLINSYVRFNNYDTNAYFLQGLVFLFMGRYINALKSFEEGARFNRNDQDILLGLGIVNFEMDNYSAGEKYILQFRDIYQPEYRETQSRAIMVCFAGLFLPAVMFLDIISREAVRKVDRKYIQNLIVRLFKWYTRYALDETPELHEKRLIMDKINLDDDKVLMNYLKYLIKNSLWLDAVYFYKKYFKKEQNMEFSSGCLICMFESVILNTDILKHEWFLYIMKYIEEIDISCIFINRVSLCIQCRKQTEIKQVIDEEFKKFRKLPSDENKEYGF